MGLFLHEHQQLAVDDEGASLLVGQRGQIGPGRAAVGAADDPQGPSNIGVSAAPQRRRDDQGAVVETSQIRVVEEIELGIGDAGRNHIVLGERADVRVGHWGLAGDGRRLTAGRFQLAHCAGPASANVRYTAASRNRGRAYRASKFIHSSCDAHAMANLHVRNIPDDLHERLRHYARENNCTMSTVVLSAVERELVRWEWRKRLAQRPTTDLGVDAATLLVEERSHRDLETG